MINKACFHKGCTKDGLYTITYSFKAKGYPDDSPHIQMIFPYLVCEEHHQNLKVEHIITDTAWEGIVQLMGRMRLAYPDRDSLTMNCTPVSFASAEFLSQLESLQDVQFKAPPNTKLN